MGSTESKIKVMKHYLSGGEIEWIVKDDPKSIWTKWTFPVSPSWNWAKCDYRILESPKFRLPTKEEFESLIKNFARWNENNRTLEILHDPLNILTFPLTPYYNNSENDNSTVVFGNYWSSTLSDIHNNRAYGLIFNTDCKFIETQNCNCAYNIRLVSDEPFEGGIEFNGVYWKPENEDGCYTWQEAMDNFNK